MSETAAQAMARELNDPDRALPSQTGHFVYLLSDATVKNFLADQAPAPAAPVVEAETVAPPAPPADAT